MFFENKIRDIEVNKCVSFDFPYHLDNNFEILVCSDGFYRNLDKEELRIWNQRMVDSNAKADRMLKQIFQKKISAGERDNISALYFGYTEKQGEQA